MKINLKKPWVHLSLFEPIILIIIIIILFEGTHKIKGKNMLETSRERVKFLKAGISTKTIEQLYLKSNCFKIIDIPDLYKKVEILQEINIEPDLLEVSDA